MRVPFILKPVISTENIDIMILTHHSLTRLVKAVCIFITFLHKQRMVATFFPAGVSE